LNKEIKVQNKKYDHIYYTQIWPKLNLCFHCHIYHILESINLSIEVVHFGVLLNVINLAKFSQNINNIYII